MNELSIRKTPFDLNHDVNIDVEPGVLAEENMQIIHDIDKVVENILSLYALLLQQLYYFIHGLIKNLIAFPSMC